MAAPLRALFATDGSGPAVTALEVLLDFILPTALDLEVLSVVPMKDGFMSPTSREREATAVIAHAVAEAACWTARGAGAAAVPRVVVGHPAEQLVAAAHASRPDLVVLGSRGTAGRASIAGTVAAKVARYCPVPALVMAGGQPIRRVCVGFDGSAGAERAVDFLAGLPVRHNMSVEVLAVVEEPADLGPSAAAGAESSAAPVVGDVVCHAEEIALGAARRSAARLLRRGVSVSSRALRGHAAERLAAAVEELAGDLVVIGSRGRSDVRGFALGGTSAALLATPPASLLVVRSPESVK